MQFEFPWRLGPPDGRYVVRGAGAADRVLVVATLGATERRLLRGRRGREASQEPAPAAVVTTRGTVVDAEPVAVEEAERWLADADEASAAAGFAVVVRAVQAHRIAAADPGVVLPALAHALVVRVGFGAGEEVADGRWRAARELPRPRPERRRHSLALAPQERLAALLGGRSDALLCEELALRARADVNARRWRLGALGLRAAFEAALAELPACAESQALRDRIEEIGALAPSVSAIADRALSGSLPADAVETLTAALARLEAALRARAVAGDG